MNPHFPELFSSEMIALHQVSLADINLLPLTNVHARPDHHFLVLCHGMIGVGDAGVGQALHALEHAPAAVLQLQRVFLSQTDGTMDLFGILFFQNVLNEVD